MNRLDQTIRLRGEERRRGSERRAGAQTQHLERRSVLMRKQEHFVAAQFDRRDAGVAVEERLPDDRGVFDASRRRKPAGELVLNAVDGQQERLWRAGNDDQGRIFHRIERGRPALAPTVRPRIGTGSDFRFHASIEESRYFSVCGAPSRVS